MKKLLILGAAASLVLLAGCSKSEAPSTDDAIAPVAEEVATGTDTAPAAEVAPTAEEVATGAEAATGN